VKQVTVSKLSTEIDSLAKISTTERLAASIGLALVVIVVIDAGLNVIGYGVPTLSGSILAAAHQNAQSVAVDESSRLALYSQQFFGWIAWTVIAIQAALAVLGALLLAAGRAKAWIGEWLRPPIDFTRHWVVAGCYAAAVGLLIAIFAVVRRALWLGSDAPYDLLDRLQVGSTFSGFGLVVCAVGVSLATRHAINRMRRLRFISVGILAGGMLAIAMTIVAMLVSSTNDFNLLYRPFDMFRAIQSVYLLIILAILLSLASEVVRTTLAETFEVHPDAPGTPRPELIEVGGKSDLPGVFVRLSQDTNAEFRLFHVIQGLPSDIAVLLRPSEQHWFDHGAIALVRVPEAGEPIDVQVPDLPLGLSVQVTLSISAYSDSVLPTSALTRIEAEGRPYVDWGMLKSVSAVLDPRNEARKKIEVNKAIRQILNQAVYVLLDGLLEQQSQVAMYAAGGYRNATDAAARPPSAPFLYGISPTQTGIMSPQMHASTNIIVATNTLKLDAERRLRAVFAGRTAGTDGLSPVSQLVELLFLDQITREVPGRPSRLSTFRTLNDSAREGIRRLFDVVAEVVPSNLPQVIASMQSIADEHAARLQTQMDELTKSGTERDATFTQNQFEQKRSAIEAMLGSQYATAAMLRDPQLAQIIRDILEMKVPSTAPQSSRVDPSRVASTSESNPPTVPESKTNSGSEDTHR